MLLPGFGSIPRERIVQTEGQITPRAFTPVTVLLFQQLATPIICVWKTTHNLKLHGLALQLNGPDLEVDADSTDVTLRVRVVGEPE